MKPSLRFWALAALVLLCAQKTGPSVIVIPEDEPIRAIPVARWKGN